MTPVLYTALNIFPFFQSKTLVNTPHLSVGRAGVTGEPGIVAVGPCIHTHGEALLGHVVLCALISWRRRICRARALKRSMGRGSHASHRYSSGMLSRSISMQSTCCHTLSGGTTRLMSTTPVTITVTLSGMKAEEPQSTSKCW
ncbi:hypothetical protein E2C01_025110 [Portunus trituberculatus]|uniref:Uncharacterized protein n=1 Tax=Portunus trituberculatus TaxID=210409 RepID=A0A5B7EGY9_PORTR|nr:hypothetical protein [Portunus trituberculatus]